jgi:hypothetical protein
MRKDGMIVFEVIDRLLTGLKNVRNVAQRLHDAELQSALAEVTLDSAQLKADMATVLEENARLRDEVQQLRKRADIRSKVEVRDNGLYYLAEPIAGYAKGPYCPRCLDATDRLVKLMGPGWPKGVPPGLGTFEARDRTGWTCPECVRQRR